MTRLAALVLFMLAACSSEPTPLDDGQLKDALAKLERAEADLAKAKDESAQALVSRPDRQGSTEPTGGPDDYDPEFGPEYEAPSLCWQEYCPCDETVTALDRTICRNAKGGVEMSDEQWAIGAQARDSKRQGDRLNAEMDDIMADDRAQREQLRANAERFDY